MIAVAAAAMVVSAIAMLVVPLAIRRMIDHGFSASDSSLINNYFLTMIGMAW
jgi:ATP-binding cassette subfamily B protein